MISVLPSYLDSGIYLKFNKPHLCQYPINPNGYLVLFLGGTGSNPSMFTEWYFKCLELGFHVIGLSYVNKRTTAEPCATATQWALELYVKETIFGNDFTLSNAVDVPNSITGRLLKLLQHLGWSQFYSGSTIRWDKILVSGHSLGGIMAAFLSKFENPKKVLCFSSPRELCRGIISKWGILDLTKFVCFCHTKDPKIGRAHV